MKVVFLNLFLGSVHESGSLVSIPSIQTESSLSYQSVYGRPPSVNGFGPPPSVNGSFETPSHDRRYNDGRERFLRMILILKR